VAAVIQRVVTSPVKTEYLSSGPGEPEVWGEKLDAFVFPTHALADAVALKMREAARAARHETGELGACFVHARTLENNEWDDFVRGSLGSATAKAKKKAAQNGHNGRAPELPAEVPADRTDLRGPEFAIRMDPRRAAEVLRDPVEVD
jgi:hypothetical protein